MNKAAAIRTDFTGWRQWLGLPYRPGADPRRDGASDCVGLVAATLAGAGYRVPWRSSWCRMRFGSDDLVAEEIRTVADQLSSPQLWAIVQICSGQSLRPALGVVVQEGLLLTAAHDCGVSTVPLDRLRVNVLLYALR